MQAFMSMRWTLMLGLAALFSACGGGGSDAPPPPTSLNYSAPASVDVGEIVQWNPTVSGIVGQYSVTPALPSGLTLNTSTGVIAGSPSAGAPLAVYTVMASNNGGSTTYSLQFAVRVPPVGPSGEVKAGGTSEQSPIALTSVAPTSGEALTVSLSVPGATHLDLSIAGSGCGTVAPVAANAAVVASSGTVGSSGQCLLIATAVTSAGVDTYTAEFTVTPSGTLTGQGLSVSGGVYFPSGDPLFRQASTAVAVAPGSLTVPQALVNGGAASIYFTQSGSSIATQAIVQFSSVPGYFLVPLTFDSAANAYRVDIQAGADFFNQLQPTLSRSSQLSSRIVPLTSASGSATDKHGSDKREAALAAIAANSTTITAGVVLVAPDGGISAPTFAQLPIQSVGSGPIQVSLSWAGAVDVDLHVTTPAGTDVFYGNRSDSTGGALDLDSNAGCRLDHVNNENIAWANSASPASGAYEVRVDYWSNCNVSTSIPYTVRVTNCGVSKTYTGVLTTGQVDQGGSGSGQLVARIDYLACSGLSVAGIAKYDDYVPTVNGLSPAPRALPIRYASVEVHQTSDDRVLASGQTDENGKFALTFSMQTLGKYYVKVLATQELDWLSQQVVNTSGAIYAIKTPDLDAATTPNIADVTLVARRGGSFAEAFNIFDLGVEGFKETKARSAVSLPRLTWRWANGQPTCGGSASCYQDQDSSIYVLSSAADADEYDDAVLAHEFGHFVVHQISRDNSQGGRHDPSTPSAPVLAWSEGVATFIGQRIVKSSTYIDTNASSSSYYYDIENLPRFVPLGTADGSIGANVSEAVVSAVLWDLADLAEDRKTVGGVVYADKITNVEGVFSVLKSLRSRVHDRGATGVDLVDFLDEWLCSVPGAVWDTVAGNNLNGLVTKLNGFPFSPSASQSCQ